VILDCHLPDKIKAFTSTLNSMKSPMLKERALLMFVKNNWAGLVHDAPVKVEGPAAAATSHDASGGASGKKRGHASTGSVGTSEGNSKKPRADNAVSAPKKEGARAAAAAAAAASKVVEDDDEEIIMSDTSDLSMDESEEGKRAFLAPTVSMVDL